MHSFIAIVKKNPERSWPVPEDFEDLLPTASARKSVRQHGSTLLLSFCDLHSYNPGIVEVDGRGVVFNGTPYRHNDEPDKTSSGIELARKAIPRWFQGQDFGPWALDGEYSVMKVGGERIAFQSGLGGAHNLYLYRSGDWTAISNRSPLFLGLKGVDFRVHPRSIGWKVLQGYVGGTDTAIEGVEKLPPGAYGSVHAGGTSSIQELALEEVIEDSQHASGDKAFFDSMPGEADFLAAYAAFAHRLDGNKPGNVPLSGGKDSRCIIGLLKRSGQLDAEPHVWTRGNYYSPEILAATDIVEDLKLTAHELLLPKYQQESKVSGLVLVRSLNFCEGMLSLFDFAGLNPQKKFVFQGHQNALRPGRFTPVPCETYPVFREAVAAILSKDHLGLLHDRAGWGDQLVAFFDQLNARGARTRDLGDLHYLLQRNPNWVAVISMADYFNSGICNPLMTDRTFRHTFRHGRRFRDMEAYHFLLLLNSRPSLIDLPFADDSWQPELLEWIKLQGLRTPEIDKLPVAPYRSHRSFPNAANPYVTNVKLRYFHACRKLALSWLPEQKKELERHIDTERLAHFLESEENPNFLVMYRGLGIMGNMLLRRYGDAVFRRSQHPAVAESLNEQFRALGEAVQGDDAPSDKAISPEAIRLLKLHEQCIAQMVRDAQHSAQKILTTPGS